MHKHDDFFRKHAAYAANLQEISADALAKYGAKRGLRNDDGTGVVVGLTEIGDVHGYIIDERERIPVEGRLRYRGIDVYDLVAGFQAEKRFGFEETAFLLLFGQLPTREKLEEFKEVIADCRELPAGHAEDLILRQPSPDIMNKLARAVLIAYSHDPAPEDYTTENLLRQSIELISRFGTYVAYCYQSKRRFFDNASMHIHQPRHDFSIAENFLCMIRQNGEFEPLEAEILDLALVIHAEHGGGNNSAFTVRVVSSSYTDTYSAIAAAVGSLKGLKHGGANNRVMAMMDDLRTSVGESANDEAICEWLSRIIRKEAFDHSGLVYGMGHAIYTLSDPRAVLLERKAKELAESRGGTWLAEYEQYKAVERLTPEVFHHVKKSYKVIAPNVDFWSGFVYRALGIPSELFTPLFAISRITGWCAHRIEELSGDSRIIRPAYKSVSGKQDYIPLFERQWKDADNELHEALESRKSNADIMQDASG